VTLLDRPSYGGQGVTTRTVEALRQKLPRPATLGKYTATGPPSTGTTWAVVHSLGTRGVVPGLVITSSGAGLAFTYVVDSPDQVTLTFANQTANTLDVTVVG
jgi:hypothetical protein